jgi:hypothetical protein
MERATVAPSRVAWRLFLTVWLVYAVFATTNVVRETYLAIALGSGATVRVDPYLDLHPDLFEIPGRGAYINSNPGASLVAALPYAVLVRPAIALAVKLRPAIAAPKPPAAYDDPRPNRTRFMNAARARGLDITLGLAAIGITLTVMAPLGAAGAVLMFVLLRARLPDERQALVYSLVFALATPMLFRAAFLNQNAILAYLVLAAWAAYTGITPRSPEEAPPPRMLVLTGVLLGFGLVCDYSAIPFLVVFGLWILVEAWQRGGAGSAVREAALFSAGALAAVTLLFAYQWAAFGHPFWPAQHYMPPTEFSVRGWLGFTLPTRELLVGNLIDLRYGLFAFCPLLIAAAGTRWARRQQPNAIPRRQVGWIVAALIALLVFASSTQFANLQWNTGVRYMIPALPLVFLLAVPVLASLHPWMRWGLIGLSGLVTLAVTMTREDIPTALRLVASDGPTLPILIVLEKMGSGYDLRLPSFTFWIVAALIAGCLTLIWRFRRSPRFQPG